MSIGQCSAAGGAGVAYFVGSSLVGSYSSILALSAWGRGTAHISWNAVFESCLHEVVQKLYDRYTYRAAGYHYIVLNGKSRGGVICRDYLHSIQNTLFLLRILNQSTFTFTRPLFPSYTLPLRTFNTTRRTAQTGVRQTASVS
jgi:hypothetical protein